MNSSDPSIKEQYRSLMQVWGTDFRRAQDSEYWTKKYKQFIDSSDDTDYITTDCRFENELELGTHSIFLYNPYTTTTYSHASESISGKNFDIEIVWYPEMSFGKVFNTFQYLLDHVYDQSYCDFNKLKEIYGRLKEAS
jgi:hypothetical protein